MKNELENHVVIKLPEVVRRTTLSKASIYVFIKDGRFPRPIPLGARSVVFLESEIDQWIRTRVEMRNQCLEVVK